MQAKEDSTEPRELRGGEIVDFPDPLLVQRLEEAFGVLLPDQDLASVKTVGDLYRLILIELKTQPTPAPAVPFHRLRQALQNWTPRKYGSLRPSTQLASLFPRKMRGEDWKRLGVVSGLELPPLRPFRWLRDAIRITTGLAATAVFVGMVLFTRPHGLLWFPPLMVAFFAGLITYRSLFVATQPLVLEFPVGTLGQLAQRLVEERPEAFAGEGRPPLSPEQVWEEMLLIVASGLGPEQQLPVDSV